jgi:L-iditol 2-dehydrogenase
MVKGLEADTPVVVDPRPPCGKCANCLAHDETLCLSPPRIDPGGLAEYVRLRPPLVEHIHRIPLGLSYTHAAYTEIVACVMQAIETAAVSFGDTVAVVGCGPVALLFIQLARLREATRVFCLHNHAERKAAIVETGGIPVNVREHDASNYTRRLIGGRGADIVVEAAGRSETYALAFALVRPSGPVIGFGGRPVGTGLFLDLNRIHYNGIHFIGSYHYPPGGFERALTLLVSGQVDLGRMITHQLPLEAVAQAPKIAKVPECLALSIIP